MIRDFINAAITDLATTYPSMPSARGKAAVYSTNDPPPRLAWVQTKDEYAPNTTQVGGNPRALYLCHAGLDVHIWHTSYDLTEQLAYDVASTCQRIGYGYVAIQRGEWASDTGADLENYGALYILSLTVDIPVVDMALPTKIVTSMPRTVTAVLPNSSATVETT